MINYGNRQRRENEKVADVPWWALSPSPFSITFYIVLIAFAADRFLAASSYRRLKFLAALTDAFFLVGLVVLSLDTVWVLCSGLRFGALHPEGLRQLAFVAGRNVAGIVLCLILVGGYFTWLLKFGKTSLLAFAVNVGFMATWFALSPSPAWTDWTYAIRYDYPFTVMFTSFLVSHGVGKGLVTALFLSLWPQAWRKMEIEK